MSRRNEAPAKLRREGDSSQSALGAGSAKTSRTLSRSASNGTWVTLDASATAAWLLPDEASAATDALYHEAVSAGGRFQAPALWMWESGNLLRTARRRGRLTAAQLDQSLGLLCKARVRLEPAPDESRVRTTLALASDHDLTFYDASYLEQALRSSARLATRDAALVRAAATVGVLCIDL